jgi:hypothetical protein
MSGYKFLPDRVTIPISVLKDSRLSPLTKFLYYFIEALDTGDRGCYASNAYLATYLSSIPTTVAKMVGELKSCGYVSQDSFDGRTRVLKVNREFVAQEDNKTKKQMDLELNQTYSNEKGRLIQTNNHIYIDNNKGIKDSFKGSKDPLNDPIDSLSTGSLGEPGLPPLNPLSKNLLNLRPMASLIRQQTSPPVKIKPMRVSDKVLSVLNYQTFLGLRRYKDKGSKTFRNCIQTIAKLLQGTFFDNMVGFEKYWHYPFSIGQQKEVLDRVALAMKPDYEPRGEGMKKMLRGIPYCDLAYNPNARKYKSWFITFFESPPQLLSRQSNVKLVDDPNPQVTSYLRRWYTREILGGVKPDFSNIEENDFRMGSGAAVSFFNRNRGKIILCSSPYEMARDVCEAILDNSNGDLKYITTKAFWKPRTWNEIVPKYFNSQAILRETREED